ncbi:hypothetical protein CDL12_20643 [Handroanthus impetiginosus]|uniref:Uncharacterized protein n=1 Tax=Handroanthus impetiginosus TaxID=429701 RepID=A0A2G9GNB2_9LAMI|nr:hypothetical protein CDL12_20643 [Handroanthus impetiginosus]
MQPVDDKKETVTFRGVSRDEEGRKRVEKVEVVDNHNIDTLKYIGKKLTDKGIQRQERHPIDGLPMEKQPKSGHEGPEDDAANELEEVPAAIDKNDPNYVDEEAEGRILRGEVSGVEGMVVGEIDVPKLAEKGVGRVDVDPKLQANV